MLTRKRKYDDETPKQLEEKQGDLEALERLDGVKKLRAAADNNGKKKEQKPRTHRARRSASSSSSSSEEKNVTRKKRQVVETTSAEESSTDSCGKRRKVHSKREYKSRAASAAHKSAMISPKDVSTTKKARQISPLSLPQQPAAPAAVSSPKSATLPVVSPLSSPKPAPESAVVAVSTLKSVPKAASSYTRRMQAAAIESDDEDLRDDYYARSDCREERRDENVILEPPVMVNHQPRRRKGGWFAAIAVLLGMLIAEFFSEPSLVAISVQEGVKQWCAGQAPGSVLPSFTNSISKEERCLSKYKTIARTRDACISTTVPNETIAGITDKVRDWTVHYICSAGSIANITPISTTDDRPLVEESKKQTKLKPRTKAKKTKDAVVTKQQGKNTAVAVRPSRGVKLPLVRRMRLLLMAVLTTFSSTMLGAISGALLTNAL